MLAPGGGQKTVDCAVEWGATAPLARATARPKAKFVCRDSDPACDTDAVAGQCTIEVLPCTAVADGRVSTCDPSAPVNATVAPRGSVKDVGVATALGASLGTILMGADVPAGTCGPSVHAVLPLAGRRTAKRTFQVAAPATGAVERDALKVACTAAD